MSTLSHHATILPVNDLQQSLDFYTRSLGFVCTFTWEDPVCYAVLKRDGVSIHLALRDEEVSIPDNIICYIFCEQIEQVFHEFQAQQIEFEAPLNNADYGMREFVLKDPAGFRIAFGEETK